MKGFVVMVLSTKWETNSGVTAEFKHPVVGVLPVYATREDAQREWPGLVVHEIQAVAKEE